jgi:hypothetical protein
MKIAKGLGPLALGVGLSMVAGTGVAGAQTVIVRNVAPGAPLELVLNAARVASAAADAQGTGTLVVPPTDASKDATTERRVFVDECGNMRRVLLVDAGLPAPAADSLCARTAVPDLFEMRAITSLVVDGSTGRHTILIRQGPAPDEWLHPVVDEGGGSHIESHRDPLPSGVILSGGLAGGRFGNVVSNACGTQTTSCSGGRTKGAVSAGAALWLTHFLGVEATYLKSQDVKTSGSGTNYTFDTVFQPKILILDGKLGVQAGPVRFYGFAGADRTWATFSTTQTVTGSVGVQGGTETLALKTAGWGFVAGGGMDIWTGKLLAIYMEGGRAALKGPAVDKGDGSLDDHLTFVGLGLRLHIGR